MSLLPSLTGPDDSFFLPVQYSVALDYTEDDLGQKIEEMASFVSKIYARFPTLNWMGRAMLNRNGVWIGELDVPPPTDEVEKFEAELKWRIITILHQQDVNRRYVHLKTAYSPEGVLNQVANLAFAVYIKENRTGIVPPTSFLFPYGTTTLISLEEKKLKLVMDFQSPELDLI